MFLNDVKNMSGSLYFHICNDFALLVACFID